MYGGNGCAFRIDAESRAKREVILWALWSVLEAANSVNQVDVEESSRAAVNASEAKAMIVR